MITLHAISVAQSLNLDSGEMDNVIVLRLPDGTECNAVVPDAIVGKIVEMANGAKAKTAAAPEPEQPPDQPLPPPPQAKPTPAGELNWERIPDEQLSPQMKAAMKYLNVPNVLTVTAINNLLTQIGERFGQEEWAEVLERFPNWDISADQGAQQAPQPVPQPAPQPPQQVPTTGLQPPQPAQAPRPPIGEVQWQDGTPMMPGTNPGRTVQADEKGYPLVKDGSVDPGEVVAGGGEADEDGVGQF